MTKVHSDSETETLTCCSQFFITRRPFSLPRKKGRVSVDVPGAPWLVAGVGHGRPHRWKCLFSVRAAE